MKHDCHPTAWSRQTRKTEEPPRSDCPGQQDGMALVLVLAFLVLITVLVLAFFSSVTTELTGAKSSAGEATTKELADSAAQIVMGAIRQASSGSSPVDGSVTSWASQPGMVRTYSTSGSAVVYYKLYSSDNMTVMTFPFNSGSDVPIYNTWHAQPALYTDLNSPVVTSSGSALFPIVDGNAIATGNPAAEPIGLSLGYYVGGTTQVAGFYIPYAANVGTTGAKIINYNATAPVHLSGTNNPVPMPVKWIYQLKDGTLTTPTGIDVTGKIANWTASTNPPSATNPIVGRIAFWTDDETCKININTASESATGTTSSGSSYSSYADTPRVCSKYDLNMADCPAYTNEFQRYPGHPATVSLSTVFGTGTLASNYPENFYSITPRTMPGGSLEATVTTYTSSLTPSTATALPIRADRLYSSIDELLFQPALSGSTRGLNSTSFSGTLNPQTLEQAKFFITASSRAPDVNLFEQPRVCMWPINSATDSQHRTALDQVFAFCSTINSGTYYFQRSSYQSTTEYSDFPQNANILTYLKTLCSRPVPGFVTGGSTFATKYSATNAKGGTELQQILMEVFDYIRCTNLIDNSGTSTPGFVPFSSAATVNKGTVFPSYNSANDTKGFGRFPTVTKAAIQFIVAGSGTNTVSGSGTVSPVPQIASSGTGPAVAKNMVRVQAALLFSMFDPSQGFMGSYPNVTLSVTSPTVTWNYGTMFTSGSVSAIPGTGYGNPGWGGCLGTRFLVLNASGETGYSIANSSSPLGKGVYPFYTQVPQSATDPMTPPDFPVGGTISIGAGDVTVQVLGGGTTSATSGTSLLQTITFHFPSTTVPVPRLSGSTGVISYPIQVSGGNYTTASIYQTNFTDPPTASSGTYSSGRWDATQSQFSGSAAGWTREWNYLIDSSDSVASVQSESGDFRLIAARNTIPTTDTLFKPHPLYGGTMAHSLMEFNGDPETGATRGQLVSTVASYHSNLTGVNTVGSLAGATPVNDPLTAGSTSVYGCEPEGFGSLTTGAIKGVTSGTASSWTSSVPPGDWDNGTGPVRDGPYINKVDEGSAYDVYPQGTTIIQEQAYFSAHNGSSIVSTTYFSPNREVASPVMLGSLPTGVIGEKPWQTLLFHPDYTGLHAGSKAPMDHLILDLFNMPVVEPYPISEPLSTAGRINMNYQIAPFTYITRNTGLRAVLQSQQMLCISNTSCGSAEWETGSPPNLMDYKSFSNLDNPTAGYFGTTTFRCSINPYKTLLAFQARFNNNDLFRSPSEICTLDLVPNDASDTAHPPGSAYSSLTSTTPNSPDPMQAYWQDHQLTGDNSLERPYANIYPLLTTKSNTFTVHMRVQTLKKGANTDPTKWMEGTDVIVSEYRGSQTIERYVDPSDTTIPDFTQPANSSYSLDSYPNASGTMISAYKFRVLESKKFTP